MLSPPPPPPPTAAAAATLLLWYLVVHQHRKTYIQVSSVITSKHDAVKPNKKKSKFEDDCVVFLIVLP